jgi:hypothetical protein
MTVARSGTPDHAARYRGVCLPCGKLAVHEEFPDATTEAVDAFLDGARATQSGATMR